MKDKRCEWGRHDLREYRILKHEYDNTGARTVVRTIKECMRCDYEEEIHRSVFEE